MKCTKVQETIQRSLGLIRAEYPLVERIVTLLQAKGARVFLAGGAVRDMLLGKSCKDIDIEVHGITADVLEKVLRQCGYVRLIGKAFGVFRIDGLDVDWSLPRKDSAGRHPEVIFDYTLTIQEACRRRDLTMNAMLIDMQTYELEDPFNGLSDIQDKVLRAPDTTFFTQDPLRFYRVMQFIGRFQMAPDKELSAVCAAMDLSAISQERVFEEFDKLFLYSTKPSLAFRWLLAIDRLQDLLPELYATYGVRQNLQYHPEGDVFEHTMQALDGAAQLVYETPQERLTMVYASLCHDLGKAVTSRVLDGVIRSHGHDVAGVPLAEALLDRITGARCYKKPVGTLVRCHMMPVSMIKNNAGAAAYKRLARTLAPESSLRVLHQLAYIDKSARNPDCTGPLPTCPEPLLETFLKQAKRYRVLDAPEDPLLMGADLLQEVGAGPALGALLRRAYELQIEEDIHDKNELKKRVLSER